MVSSRRAIAECLESALGEGDTDCDLVIIHASLGHDYAVLLDETKRLAPSARIVGSSCCGIVGREGVSESMKDLAIMVVRGASELAVASVDGIYGQNSYDKAVELATRLKAINQGVNMVYFLASGIDIADDQCIAGIESVFGPDVTIFGATSADNMKGVVSYQLVDDQIHEHAAYAVGFADPTLSVVTQATHGFVAVGSPLVVTRSKGNRIIELDGRPAWSEYTRRLALPETAVCGDTIPIGALAEQLSPELAAEYGNDHILRVVTKRDPDGTMHYATTCPEGTRLWLTVRDEARIFSDMDRMMGRMLEHIGGREVLAVFHADCLARGRVLFNRVMKEELVGRMQFPLAHEAQVPPWLGMYGFGEFARLGGLNQYHNYTTAISALCRGPAPT
ncbi:MAG: hypothetical protein EOM91_09120 [Sphingobacteriia bacterium]|nr:hypothetical protein [Sphingobacteriia bacterium]NCC38561.1 hypothetical protein [Gammaproteobacteria bacterium]